MADRPYNKDRLSEAFDNAIANSRDERIQDFYGTDLDAAGIMERAERLADTILHGAKDVVSDTSVQRAQAELVALVSSQDTQEKEFLFQNALRVIDERVGYAIVSMQACAEERFMKLVMWGGKALVDPRTAEYLRRVSQCYLLGLDEQCVIMRRSVLEAAFLQAVPDSFCQSLASGPGGTMHSRKGSAYMLGCRIEAAKEKRIAGDDTDGMIEMARFVNSKANDLVHPDRDACRELDAKVMDDILMKTVIVIRVLAAL